MSNSIKDRIKEELKRRCIKIPALAQQAGIPKDRIYGWYRDKTSPKAEDQAILEKWLAGETSTKNEEISNNVSRSTVSRPNMPDIPGSELLKAITTLTESNKGLVDSNKSITDTNRVIADTNSILAMKLVQQESIGSDQPGIPASALATIMALREQVIELTAAQLNISAQEAESVLGIKAVAAMKRVSKKDIPSGEGMKHKSETH
jgi:hypothetical protein